MRIKIKEKRHKIIVNEVKRFSFGVSRSRFKVQGKTLYLNLNLSSEVEVEQ